MPAFATVLRGRRGGVARPARRGARAGGPAHRGDRRTRSCARDARVDAVARNCSREAYDNVVRRSSSRSFGGFGSAPKFPQAMTLDFLLPRLRPQPAPADARDGHDHARRDGRRRHVRPGRRRIRTATRPTTTGSCRTSRRCSTTTRCSHARTCTRTSSPASRATGGSSRRRSSTCCATSATPRAASSPPRTPTPKAIEGKFYLWSSRRSQEVCGDDADEVIRYFGVTEAGNFDDPHTRLPGQHPPRRRPDRRAVRTRCSGRRAQLLDPATQRDPARARRQGPARRGTRCSSSALIEAAAAFDRDDWRGRGPHERPLPPHAAAGRDDGRLLRSWRAALPRLRRGLRRAARGAVLAGRARRRVVARLRRPGRRRAASACSPTTADGGFFTTGHDAERLVVRQKDVFDNATPSANSLAAERAAPVRRARRGDRRYEEPAVRVLTMLGRVMSAHPTSFAHAARGGRALDHAAARGRDRRRRATISAPRRSSTRCRTGSSRTRCCSSRNRARARARRCSPTARCSTACPRLRVRGLRVPAAGHEPGRAAHPARRRARRAPASDYVER